MTDRTLYIVWAFLYGVCTALGFVPVSGTGWDALFFMIAMTFFIPGAVLLFRAVKNRDRQTLCRIRNLSLLSLCLTLAVLVLNFLTYNDTAEAGRIAYWLLILVSTPMICSQVWVVSLFCWGCFLTVCLQNLTKKKK